MNKTLWQKIYSFFGFWTYIWFIDEDHTLRVLYWINPLDRLSKEPNDIVEHDLIMWRIYDR